MQHEVGLAQDHQNNGYDLDRQGMITVDAFTDDRESAGRNSCDRSIDRIEYRHAKNDIGDRAK